MGASFIGQGIAFPLHADSTGALALVGEVRELEEAIRLILATTPGERPMRPEFGCRIWDHVFDVADAATAGEIAHEVHAALDRWEPRIDVLDVVVGFDRVDAGVLYIDVRYAVRRTNDRRNLVFPFYVIPEGGERPAPRVDVAVPVALQGA